ncbi:MAG: M67 family metallopeptidase [Candidatus Dormiibacterota bacterium]
MRVATAHQLLFTESVFERMAELAATAYPFEGCGVLVGGSDAQQVTVVEVVEGRNLVQDRRRDRYELDPRDIINADRDARELGLEVIGFYHTHPDHPARPSRLDTERAWPGYLYVVISVNGAKLGEATAWRLAEGEGPSYFEEVPLEGGHRGPGYNPPGLVAEVS